jgi:hypothetical protein
MPGGHFLAAFPQSQKGHITFDMSFRLSAGISAGFA